MKLVGSGTWDLGDGLVGCKATMLLQFSFAEVESVVLGLGNWDTVFE